MRRNRDDRSSDVHLVAPGRAFATFNGSAGNDTIYGTNGDDNINGYGGNDTLKGGGGDDVIDGGDGDDTIDGGSGHNVLRGGAGYNFITSSGGIDTVIGTGGFTGWTGNYARSLEDLTFDAAAGTLSNGTTLIDLSGYALTTGYGDDSLRLTLNQRFYVDAGAGFDTAMVDFASYEIDEYYSTYLTAAIQIGNTIAAQGYYYDRDHERYVTLGSLSNVEQLTFIGSSKYEYFSVVCSNAAGPRAITIDGGGGDRLALDLRLIDSTAFTVNSDGTIDSSFGTFSNIASFNLALGGGTNSVTLGAGNDSISAAGTGDILDGGAGNDVISAAGPSAVVDGSEGDDTISATGTGGQLHGGAGNDVIATAAAGTLVDGGDGIDVWQVTVDGSVAGVFDQADGVSFNGIQLVDIEAIRVTSALNAAGSIFRLDGSGPALTLAVTNASDRVTIDLSDRAQAATAAFGYDSGYVLATDTLSVRFSFSLSAATEIVRVIGSAFDDSFVFSGLSYLGGIDGGAGSDLLQAYLGVATGVQFVVAADGTVTSNVGTFANLERFDLTLSASNNVVATGDGDDVIDASRYTSPQRQNLLSGGGGDDAITGGRGADRLNGEAGDDYLVGGDSNDVLSGGAGNDIIDGGTGTDAATYADAARGVRVTVMYGVQDTHGAGMDLLNAIENLVGSSYADVLTGDLDANWLVGGIGNDRLAGMDGDDVLTGGTGVDRVSGGAGADTFVFAALADIATEGRDRILDFSHTEGDRIDLSAIDPGAAVGDQAFIYIGTAQFSGGNAELRVRDQGNGAFLVQGDVDYDGRADFAMIVTTDQPLTAADFVL